MAKAKPFAKFGAAEKVAPWKQKAMKDIKTTSVRKKKNMSAKVK